MTCILEVPRGSFSVVLFTSFCCVSCVSSNANAQAFVQFIGDRMATSTADKAPAVFVSGKRLQLLSHVKRPTLCSSAASPVKALPDCSLAHLRG